MINLRELAAKSHLFGNQQGREIFQKLLDHVNSDPTHTVFAISLDGVKATDGTFPRESVISLAKQFRSEKWFCLTDFRTRDLFDNWNYAANVKKQMMVVWTKDGYELLGPDVSSSARKLIDYVFCSPAPVTAPKVAEDLDISVQNASTKLKNLFKQGLIMRNKEVAESGGLEYTYEAPKVGTVKLT